LPKVVANFFSTGQWNCV